MEDDQRYDQQNQLSASGQVRLVWLVSIVRRQGAHTQGVRRAASEHAQPKVRSIWGEAKIAWALGCDFLNSRRCGGRDGQVTSGDSRDLRFAYLLPGKSSVTILTARLAYTHRPSVHLF